MAGRGDGEVEGAMQTPDGAWRIEVVRRNRSRWYRIVHGDDVHDWLSISAVERILDDADVDRHLLVDGSTGTGPVHNPVVRFRATVQLGGKTATGIPVPEDVVLSFGAGRRVKVRVTIGDYTYRSTVGPYGGAYMLPLSAEHRQGAGVAAGDEIDIGLELDDAPREVPVPPDLAEALSADTAAAAYFDGLSYTHKRRYVLWIDEAKKADTRQRRVTKCVEMLREGRTGV